jgi:hypothetical protein
LAGDCGLNDRNVNVELSVAGLLAANGFGKYKRYSTSEVLQYIDAV